MFAISNSPAATQFGRNTATRKALLLTAALGAFAPALAQAQQAPGQQGPKVSGHPPVIEELAVPLQGPASDKDTLRLIISRCRQWGGELSGPKVILKETNTFPKPLDVYTCQSHDGLPLLIPAYNVDPTTAKRVDPSGKAKLLPLQKLIYWFDSMKRLGKPAIEVHEGHIPVKV